MNKGKNIFTRRDFIKLSSSLFAAVGLGVQPGCSPVISERSIQLGVQLYSVRHELAEDFRGTIARLAGMGFEGVEFADYFNMTATELKEILDGHGLRSCGTHVYLDDLLSNAYEESVAFNKTLGNEIFIIRWIPADERDTPDSFLRYIDKCNEVVERLDTHGMRLGYHNHDYIFGKFDDEYLWDILARNTDGRFILQLDTGHAAGMGQDPVELLRRHPGRTASIHAKAYSSRNEAAVIGEDELDWPGIIRAAKEAGGTEWFILEYEIEGVPPLEALKATIDNFRTIRSGVTA